MKFSFSTGTFYYRDLGWCLRLAEQAGFDGVEYVIGPDYFLRGEDTLSRVAAAHPGKILSVHPPFSLLAKIPGVPWPTRGSGSWPRTLRATSALGAPVAVTHTVPFTSWGSPRAARYLAALKAGREAAPEVTLTLESAQRSRRRVTLLDDVRMLVRVAEENGCGITLDTCHAGYNGEDLLETYAVVRPMLRNIHFSDLRRTPNGMLRHLVPGEGTLPLATLLGQLARDHYTGLVTLEVHPAAIGLRRSLAPEQPMREMLEWMRSAAS